MARVRWSWTPTRELAAQVHDEFERLARHTRLGSLCVFGGVPIARQERALRRGPDVIVACPGRLLDLLQRGGLRLDGIEVLVLDEADHMFDMGFLPDVRRILKALPESRQNLLFSATMPREIRRLADGILNKPAVVELAHSRPAGTIQHGLYEVAEGGKAGVLQRLLVGPGFRSAIVFVRTKHRARRLAQQLDRRGHRAIALQGNMSQSQRDRALRGFREERYDVLVATDIAARGLDIAGVSHVVNFDVPNTPEAFTHRVGRTGRSGLAGTAFTIATSKDAGALHAIEKLLGESIPRLSVAELGQAGAGARARRERSVRPVSTQARAAKRKPERPPTSQEARREGAPTPALQPLPPAAPRVVPVTFGQGVIDDNRRRLA